MGALPLLWSHLAATLDSVAAYQLLYHEANLVNLLEVRHSCHVAQLQITLEHRLTSLCLDNFLPALQIELTTRRCFFCMSTTIFVGSLNAHLGKSRSAVVYLTTVEAKQQHVVK